jgi:hypothetical protein
MGLKNIYSSIEEKYYDLMDYLDNKGIPVYKVIDFFESRNIPSFPLAIIFVLMVLFGLFFAVSGSPILKNTVQFEVQVTDGISPLKGATVSYSLEGKTITATTNEEGKAVIEVAKGEFTLTATKKNFKKATKTFNSEKTLKGIIELEVNTLEPITVQLLGKGNEILKEEIKVYFSCSENPEWTETVNVITGTTTLEEVPLDCGKIIANPIGKECIESCDFDSDESLIKIYLEEETKEKGTINFTVIDEKGNYLNGINVMVIPTGSNIAETSCVTFEGICKTEVFFGEYYIRTTDYTGEFQDYDSREENKTVVLNSSNQNIYFEEIKLKEGVIGQIKIKVKDEEGNPIENALIKLYKDSTKINEKRTVNGEAEFNVAEEIDYTVSITHPDYLNLEPKILRPKFDFYEFTLRKATPSNTRKITVTVVDEKNEPIENTKVFLKDALTGSITGQEKVTGFDGKAFFERLKEGKYIVRAEKRGFEGKDSRVIEVKEKEPQEVTIKLNIGQGTLDVTVLDTEKQPIQSARVKVIDYLTGKELYIDSTDTQGKKSFSIRADKKVFLEVNESAHSNYISAPIQMFDGREEKTIILEDSIDSFEVKLEELSLMGMKVENASVTEGRTYKAKFKLMVPKGIYSNNAGIHIRTGADTKNQNNTMEKDDLYIKKVLAANAKIIKGTTFNPNTGEGIDFKHLTSGNAKWANVIFNSVKEGTYEIEALIQIRESTKGGAMELAYRAWVEANGFQRDPFDAELGESESIPTKQALYAKTRHEPLQIGSSSLCAENFCSSFKVKDLQNAVTLNIVDSFPAEISSSYELEFNIISINDRTYSDSEIVIEGNGIKLNFYEIQGKKGEARDKIVFKTGKISKGEKISGKINFTTKREGTNRINLSLYGKTENLGKEKILFNPIKAEVSHAKNMKIFTAPKNLVPFIKNNLLVRITDEKENELSEVEIRIEKDSEVIALGKTDTKGIYAIELEAMNAGTKIKVIAEKAGFNPAEKELPIQKNIVQVIPEEINESFNVKKQYRTTREITLKNTTEMPLTVIAAELTDSFKELIDAEIEGIGKEVVMGSEEQILISFGLTEKGKKVNKLTSLNGEIAIVLENLKAGKQWVVSVPIKVTIGLGGEVDSTDCFSLNPQEWVVLTQNKKTKETKLVLANNCTVQGEPIALKNVKAKISWKENAIGEFRLTSSIEGTKTVTLKNSYQTIAENFNPNAEEENLSLSFNPDSIPVASGKATIYLEATNPTEKGEQKLKQKIEVKVEISSLQECIRVKPTGNQLRISMNYYNFGWGYTPNYFGYNPANVYAWYMEPNYLNSRNRSYPFYSYPYDPTASPGSLRNNPNVIFPSDWRTQRWPHTQYLAPYSNPTAYNPALNYGWNFTEPGKATIEIENSCPSAIQIELEGAPEISLSDSTITLTQGKQETIEVTPSIFIGQYPLKIKAKHKNSSEAPIEIARYNILIESEFERNYYDCISLDKRVFEFNDIIQKPVEGTVWNTCYDLGVRLTFNSIPRNLKEGINYGFPFDYGMGKEKLKSSGIIDFIELIQLINKPGPNGKIIQELKFRMWKNFDYYKVNEAELPTNENPLIKLANLRIRLTGLYYKVEAEERLPITFIDRTGLRQVIPFDIIIEDLWAISEQNIINFGNPNIPHQACIISDALDFSDCIPEELFEGGITKYIDAKKVINKGKNYCGSTDRLIKIINNEIIDDSGIKLNFSIENGDKIKLKVNKTKMQYNPGLITGKVYARLTRVNPATTKTVEIPFSVCIEGLPEQQKVCREEAEQKKEIERIAKDESMDKTEKIKKIITELKEICEGLTTEELKSIAEELTKETEIKACEEGLTGISAFKEYGFNKLKFDWKWNSIKENECDTGDTYCDSTQFAIELNKKAKNIEELNVNQVVSECKGYCDKKDSENLFRFVVDKTKVVDSITGKAYYFFLDESNSIIAGKKFKKEAFKNEIESIESMLGNLSSNAATITSLVNIIIEEMQQNPSIEEESIIGEIDSTNLNIGKLKGIGAEIIKGSTSKYVITFNEYKELRNKLQECTSQNQNTKECEIKEINSNNTMIIDLQFLKKLQENIEFKVGIRNIQGITEENKRKVMKEGKTIIAKLSKKTLEEFYNENIEFSSYLKEDGFSEDFKTDFKEAYTQEIDSFNEWTFNKNRIEAGKHKIVFNYDWAGKGKETEIKITKEQELEELNSKYARNYFFKLPFDGKTGIREGKLDRKGYGLGYGQNDSVDEIYLNEEISLKKTDRAFAGLKEIEAKKYELYGKTRNGRILYIDERKLDFTPSKALGLKLELEETYNKAKGVFYDLIAGTTSDERKVIGLKKEKELNYLFEWTAGKDKKQKEGNLDSRDPACSAERFGIIFTENDASTQKTVSFIPVEWSYSIQKHCNKGIKEMKAFEFRYETGEKTKVHTIPFSSSETPLNINQKANLKKWIEEIKTENVCFTPGENSFSLEWNKEKLLKEMKMDEMNMGSMKHSTVTLEITGIMDCKAMCINNIKEALESLNGVMGEVKFDPADPQEIKNGTVQVTVIFMPDMTNQHKLIEVIENTESMGVKPFSARVVSE